MVWSVLYTSFVTTVVRGKLLFSLSWVWQFSGFFGVVRGVIYSFYALWASGSTPVYSTERFRVRDPGPLPRIFQTIMWFLSGVYFYYYNSVPSPQSSVSVVFFPFSIIDLGRVCLPSPPYQVTLSVEFFGVHYGTSLSM